MHTRVSISAPRFLPGGGRDHGLDFGFASIDRNQEEDVMQWNGSCHGLGVVFVIYSKIRAGSVASPAHRQVQRRGLNAFRRHLTRIEGDAGERQRKQTMKRDLVFPTWYLIMSTL